MEAAASPVAASTAPAMHKLMESMCNPEIFMVLGGAPPALQALGARLVSDPALIAKLTAVPSLQHLLSELLADPVLLESVVHNDEARTLTRAPRSRALARAHAPRWGPFTRSWLAPSPAWSSGSRWATIPSRRPCSSFAATSRDTRPR